MVARLSARCLAHHKQLHAGDSDAKKETRGSPIRQAQTTEGVRVAQRASGKGSRVAENDDLE